MKMMGLWYRLPFGPVWEIDAKTSWSDCIHVKYPDHIHMLERLAAPRDFRRR